MDTFTKEVKRDGRIIVPIKVVPIKDNNHKYQIVYGHRRFLASKRLGWKTIPAIIEDNGTRKVLLEMGTENITRKDWNPIELGDYFNSLISEGAFKNAKEIADYFHYFKTDRTINMFREISSGVSDKERKKRGVPLLPYDTLFRVIVALKKRHFSKEQELMFDAILKHKISGNDVREHASQIKRLIPKNLNEIAENSSEDYKQIKNDVYWIINRILKFKDKPQRIERTVNYILAGDKELKKVLKLLEEARLEEDEDKQEKLLKEAERILVEECLRLYKKANYHKREKIVEQKIKEIDKVLKSSLRELSKKRHQDNPKEIFVYNVFPEEKIRPDGYGSSSFHGNCSPTILKQCLLRYTEQPRQIEKDEIKKLRKEDKDLTLDNIDERDLVLDSMIGSGTTIDVCKELQRSCIGIDLINPFNRTDINIGDARRLLGKTFKTWEDNNIKIKKNSVDFIFNHFPYWDMIKYTNKYATPDRKNDLSMQKSLKIFLKMSEDVFKENFKILKPKKYYAVLIGDVRRGKQLIPLSAYFINIGLKVGFKLHDVVVKVVGRQERKIVESHGLRYEGSKDKSNFFLTTYDTLLVFKK